MPPNISLFPAYHEISTHLAGLPIEIVHKVFSDVQLSKLLALLCVAPNPYLDACVSSHPELGQFFPESDLPEIKRYFTVYLRVLQRGRSQECTIKNYFLDADAQVVLHRNQSFNSKNVCSAILFSIHWKISSHAELVPVYQEYHEEEKTGILIPPFHSWAIATAEESEYIVNALFTAIDGLKQLQREQLLRFAALVRDHHYMLKYVDDPSQESRTNSHKLHLQGKFELLAQKILMPWCRPIMSLFAGRVFPLVPYDRYLCLFRKTLKRWPQSQHEYPSQLKTVLDGIEFVHPRRGTPSGTKRTFQGGLCGHAFNAPNTRHDPFRRQFDAYRPWPGAEFEWLEAFITICGYMSTMLEKWYRSSDKTDTVADFWRNHLVPQKEDAVIHHSA